MKLQIFLIFALVVAWVLGWSHLAIRQDTSSRHQIPRVCQSNLRTLPIDSLLDLWDSIGVEHNTNDMTTATASRTFVHQSVNSSAISQLSVISGEYEGTYDLLVIFNSNPDKVYRYAFEDDGAALRWIDLLEDSDAREATSWGRELHRALKNGDLEVLDV